MKPSSPRTAFTLAELLIVMGIVAALAALLLPALARAREISRRTVCLSNVHQITQAWLMYANEHHGRLVTSWANPLMNFGSNWFGGTSLSPMKAQEQWDTDPLTVMRNGLLWPYLHDPKIFVCPDDPQQFYPYDPHMRVVTPVPGQSRCSYGINFQLTIGGGNGTTSTDYHFFVLSQIRRPSSTFVFIETSHLFASGFGDYAPPIYSGEQTEAAATGTLHTHNSVPEGCTISFADGHAIFWTYAYTRMTDVTPVMAAPDVLQLQTWSGGPLPPGAIP